MFKKVYLGSFSIGKSLCHECFSLLTRNQFPNNPLVLDYELSVLVLLTPKGAKVKKAHRRLKGAKATPFFQEPF